MFFPLQSNCLLYLILILLTLFPRTILSVSSSDTRQETVSRPPDAFYVWQRQHGNEIHAALKAEQEKNPGVEFFFYGGLFRYNSTAGTLLFEAPERCDNCFPPEQSIIVYRAGTNCLKASPQLFAEKIAQEVKKTPWRSFQIDLDAPESQLARYAEVLERLDELLPRKEYPRSVTLLPSHMKDRDAFQRVIEHCDFFVLQVHGIEWGNTRNPARLFHASLALQDIARADSFYTDYRIALPCYSYQLYYHRSRKNEYRKPDFVSAENTRSVQPADYRTRMIEASPEDLMQTVNFIRSMKSKHCKGILWFRLPVSGDRYCLDRESLQSLQDGKIYEKKLIFYWKKEQNGVLVLMMKNRGVMGRKTIRLNLEARASIVVAFDFFNAFRDSDGKSIYPVLPSVISGPLPPPGVPTRVLWLRTRESLFEEPELSCSFEDEDQIQ